MALRPPSMEGPEAEERPRDRFEQARALFPQYADAIQRERFSEAVEPRRRLLGLGFEVNYWRPARPGEGGGDAPHAP